MALTPEQRSMRARIAAHAMHAKTDPQEITARARAAFAAQFEAQVDPSVTDPAERARIADHLRRAHMVRLAFKSSVARSKRRAA